MYIPTECVELMRGYQYDLFCFPKDEPVRIDDMEKMSLIDIEDEEVFVFVGSFTELHISRIGLFPTLEDMKSYIDKHQRAPWGVSAISRRNHWKRISENGVSLCLEDANGRKLRFYRREGRAEIV